MRATMGHGAKFLPLPPILLILVVGGLYGAAFSAQGASGEGWVIGPGVTIRQDTIIQYTTDGPNVTVRGDLRFNDSTGDPVIDGVELAYRQPEGAANWTIAAFEVGHVVLQGHPTHDGTLSVRGLPGNLLTVEGIPGHAFFEADPQNPGEWPIPPQEQTIRIRATTLPTADDAATGFIKLLGIFLPFVLLLTLVTYAVKTVLR